MAFKFLRLPIQHFSADTGAAAGGDAGAAAGTTGTAGAGDNNAATGGDQQQGAAGDNTAGGGDKGAGSKLSAEDLQRYQESEFLKALGYDSIDDVKTALAASKTNGDTKQTGDDKKADEQQQGDKKDADPDKKAGDQAGDTKADDKTGDKKADETPPETKEPDKKPEPTVAEKEVEIAQLKAQLAATKAGVKEESLDDVLDLATALSKRGEGMEIEAAIKAIIEKYPLFAGAAAPGPGKPHFGDTGSQRQADDRDPFVRTLLGS